MTGIKSFFKFLLSHLKHIDKLLPLICIAITAFDIFLVNSMYETGVVESESVVTTQLAADLEDVVCLRACRFDFAIAAVYAARTSPRRRYSLA